MSIKELLFTQKDLHAGTKYDQITIENAIIGKGIKSRELVQCPAFQEAVSDLYLSLVVAEDELEVGCQIEKMENFRIQRRLLRQIVAKLDNHIHNMELLEQQKQSEMADNQLYQPNNPEGEDNAT